MILSVLILTISGAASAQSSDMDNWIYGTGYDGNDGVTQGVNAEDGSTTQKFNICLSCNPDLIDVYNSSGTYYLLMVNSQADNLKIANLDDYSVTEDSGFPLGTDNAGDKTQLNDWDGDGDLEFFYGSESGDGIYYTQYDDNSNSVISSEPASNLLSGSCGDGFEFADFDNDGDTELGCIDTSGNFRVYESDGSQSHSISTFSGLDSQTEEASAGDFDNDGTPEIIYTGTTSRMYYGDVDDSSDSYTDIPLGSGEYSYSITEVKDFDDDGNNEVAYTHGNYVDIWAMDVNGNGNTLYSGGYFRKISFQYTPPPQPPAFNSVTGNPEPPEIDYPFSISASLSDPNGDDITDVTLEELTFNGNVVASDLSRSGSTPEWNDVYTPSEQGTLEAQFSATDSTGETSNYVELWEVEEPVSLNEPANNSAFTSQGIDFNFSVDYGNLSTSDTDITLIVEDSSGNQEYSESWTRSGSVDEIFTTSTSVGWDDSYEWNVKIEEGSEYVYNSDTSNFEVLRPPSFNVQHPVNSSVFYLDAVEENAQGYEVYQENWFNFSIDSYSESVDYDFQVTDVIGGTPQWGDVVYTDSGTVSSGSSESFSIPASSSSYPNNNLTLRIRWETGSLGQNYYPGEFTSNPEWETELVNRPPEITLFDSTPDIGSAKFGDMFDLEVEGNKYDDQFTDATIDNITYSMDITNAQNPSNTFVDNVGQTSGAFQDYRTDVYEMKKEYCGETITFNVVVKDAEGRSVSDSISDSSVVDLSPEVTALSPNNGATLEVEPGNVRNPGYEWEIVTYSEPVDVTFYEDGDPINDGTYDTEKSDTCQTFTESFESQPERGAGSYNWRVDVEDSSGRMASTQLMNYTIEETDSPEDVPPTMTTINQDPSISELRDGDSPDIYFEGDEGTEAIDYVELEVRVDGNVEKTIVVPEEDINYGSFFSTVNDAYTMVSDWVGSTIEIVATVVGVDGSESTTSITGTASSDVGASADIQDPGNNEIITYPSGDSSASVQYNFSVSTEEDPVDIQLKRNGSTIYSAQQISSDATIPYDYTEDLSSGTYEIWVDLDNSNTGNDEYETAHRTFTVQEDTGEPVISWSNPSNEDTFFYDNGEDYSSVDFDGTITTPEDGTINLYIAGSQVNSVSVSSGSNQEFSMTENLDAGNYTAYLNFQSASFDQDTDTREFGVLEEEPSEPSVYLADPDDKATIQTGTDYGFTYYVKANRTGSLSMEIREADTGNVFYSSSGNEYDYDKVNNYAYYTDTVTLDQEGTFEWDATFNGDDGTSVTSITDQFTVQDIPTPSFSVYHPEDGDVFSVGVGQNAEVPHNSTIDLTEFDSSEELCIKLRVRDVTESNETVSPGGVTYGCEYVDGGSSYDRTFTPSLDAGTYRSTWSITTEDGLSYSSETREWEITEVDPGEIISQNEPVENDTFEVPVGASLSIPHEWDVDTSDYSTALSYDMDLAVLQNGGVDTTVNYTGENAGGVENYSYTVSGLKPDDSAVNQNDPINVSAISDFEWVVDVDMSNGDTYSENQSYTLEYLNPLELTALSSPRKTYSLSDTDSIDVETEYEVNASGLYSAENYTVNRTVTRNGLVYETEKKLGEGSGNDTVEFSDSLTVSDPGKYIMNVTATHNRSNTTRKISEEFTVFGNYRIDEYSPRNNTKINTRVPHDQEIQVELFTQEDSGSFELYFNGTKVKSGYIDVDSADNTSVNEIRTDTYLVNYTGEELGEGSYDWRFRFVPDNNDLPEIDNRYEFEIEQGLYDLVIGILNDIYDRVVGSVPGIVLFFLAALMSVIAAGYMRSWTESDELGILTFVLGVLAFVALGWIPGWVGMIIFLIAAGVAVWIVSKVATGSGGE